MTLMRLFMETGRTAKQNCGILWIVSRAQPFITGSADLADLDAGIKELEAEAERVLPAIEEFCVSISDPRMRLIFRLRFVRCRSWAEIAGTLGRYYTEAGVCKMAYNYLKKIA